MVGWLDAWRNKGNGKSAAGQKENKNRDIKRPTSVSGPTHTHTHRYENSAKLSVG